MLRIPNTHCHSRPTCMWWVFYWKTAFSYKSKKKVMNWSLIVIKMSTVLVYSYLLSIKSTILATILLQTHDLSYVPFYIYIFFIIYNTRLKWFNSILPMFKSRKSSKKIQIKVIDKYKGHRMKSKKEGGRLPSTGWTSPGMHAYFALESS